MSKWEYGGVYKNYDLSGIVELPNDSKVRVADLTAELPGFMLSADTIFCDPPCSTGNLKSFHTKAGIEADYDFDDFEIRFFERIQEIAPRHLFLEVFQSNQERFLARCRLMFPHTAIYDSFYYRKKQNRCFIIYASVFPIESKYEALNDIDEEEAIKWICANHPYKCIGDLCMGRGLVGKYAYLNGKTFVGTELNKKRLAVLVDFIAKKEKVK